MEGYVMAREAHVVSQADDGRERHRSRRRCHSSPRVEAAKLFVLVDFVSSNMYVGQGVDGSTSTSNGLIKGFPQNMANDVVVLCVVPCRSSVVLHRQAWHMFARLVLVCSSFFCCVGAVEPYRVAYTAASAAAEV